MAAPDLAASIADHARLAWLLRAIAVQGALPIAADEIASARRTVCELNNLADETLAEWVEIGDLRGIRLTARGRRLSVALCALWEEQRKMLDRFGQPFTDDLRLLERVSVRTSARNQFVANVDGVTAVAGRHEVGLLLAGGHRLIGHVTAKSVDDLGLRPGLEVLALIKASAIRVIDPSRRNDAAGCNILAGQVLDMPDDASSREVYVDLGAGLTAVALPGASSQVRPGGIVTLAIDPTAILIGIMG